MLYPSSILNILRKAHSLFCITTPLESIFERNEDSIQFHDQEASDIIKIYIESERPFVVGRLGTELFTLLNYKEVSLPFLLYCKKYITKQLYFRDWNNTNIKTLCFYTGFFPPDINEVEKFSAFIINELHNIDVWGSFYSVENHFQKELSHSIKIRLEDIDPFLHKHPWSKALEGKKILVIHPFENAIQKQYEKRDHLFENKDILPEFELITLKAIQTSGNESSEFNSWFEALDFMKKKISSIDFDIALIGCGAYSLPLATYIKSLGKGAIYIGGSLQILFGIKGKRWEEIPSISSLFNQHWIRPNEEDKIKNHSLIENSCYW